MMEFTWYNNSMSTFTSLGGEFFLAEGLNTIYDSSEQKLEIGEYVNGARQGLWITLKMDANNYFLELEVGEYQNDKKVGPWTFLARIPQGSCWPHTGDTCPNCRNENSGCHYKAKYYYKTTWSTKLKKNIVVYASKDDDGAFRAPPCGWTPTDPNELVALVRAGVVKHEDVCQELYYPLTDLSFGGGHWRMTEAKRQELLGLLGLTATPGLPGSGGIEEMGLSALAAQGGLPYCPPGP